MLRSADRFRSSPHEKTTAPYRGCSCVVRIEISFPDIVVLFATIFRRGRLPFTATLYVGLADNLWRLGRLAPLANVGLPLGYPLIKIIRAPAGSRSSTTPTSQFHDLESGRRRPPPEYPVPLPSSRRTHIETRPALVLSNLQAAVKA